MSITSINTDMYDSSTGQFVTISQQVETCGGDDMADVTDNTVSSVSDTSSLGDSIPWVTPDSSS